MTPKQIEIERLLNSSDFESDFEKWQNMKSLTLSLKNDLSYLFITLVNKPEALNDDIKRRIKNILYSVINELCTHTDNAGKS